MDAPMENLAEAVRSSWELKAKWWDDRIGDGNAFQRELVEPATLRLATPGPGQLILDIACGAGRMARLMAAGGAQVLGIEFWATFLERAWARTAAEAPIEFRLLDATDQGQLLSLGAGRFHGAVATMALMDMARIEPLFEALAALLKPGGRFVFSILHPCFIGPGSGMFAEERTEEGRTRRVAGVKVTRYRTAEAYRGEGMAGQPEPQIYFHRPLALILQEAFRNGFSLDGLEEPGFAPGPDLAFQWQGLPELAPVLVARLRRP